MNDAKEVSTLSTDEFVEAFSSWADATFPASTVHTVLDHMCDEVNEFEEKPSPEEAADVFLLACHYAHKCNFSIAWVYGELMCSHSEHTVPEAVGSMYLLLRLAQTPLKKQRALGLLVWTLVEWCREHDTSLRREAEKKWEIAQRRTWGEPNSRGVRHHVTEGEKA